MADDYLRQSPLAHLHLDARALADEALGDAGVTLTELRHRDMINLRGDAKDADFHGAVKTALGADLPPGTNVSAPARGGAQVLALGPDEWLIVTDAGKGDALAARLAKGLSAFHAAVTPVGEGRTTIRLAGANAPDVLAKGCTIDLHPDHFGPGHCAETLIARTGALIHGVKPKRGEGHAFEIVIAASFAEYLWTWLEDASREYGVRVTTD